MLRGNGTTLLNQVDWNGLSILWGSTFVCYCSRRTNSVVIHSLSYFEFAAVVAHSSLQLDLKLTCVSYQFEQKKQKKKNILYSCQFDNTAICGRRGAYLKKQSRASAKSQCTHCWLFTQSECGCCDKASWGSDTVVETWWYRTILTCPLFVWIQSTIEKKQMLACNFKLTHGPSQRLFDNHRRV